MSTSEPRTPRGPNLQGRTLGGRFDLEVLIGRGGTASVYAALDTHMRRRLAIKVIHPEHGRTEPQRRRIRNEARIAGALDHPNLTPMLDFGEERIADGETLCFLVMPLLEGRTLTGLIADGELPWQRCVSLIRQVLAAVAALHAAGVLHRDLKASNCFITPCRGRELLRVLDFGLAKIDRADLVSISSRSTSSHFVGTLTYAAPEQVLGRNVDTRADLYAVGMILYCLLTRRLPFTGSDYEVQHAIVEMPAPPPQALVPWIQIPSRLEELVLKALSKDPEDRFACAEDFDAALVEFVAAEGSGFAGSLRPCPPGHRGSGHAQEALAAWTCFEYEKAHDAARRAAAINRAWSPLALLMSLLPEDG